MLPEPSGNDSLLQRDTSSKQLELNKAITLMVCVPSAVEGELSGEELSKFALQVSSSTSQRNTEFELRVLRCKKLDTLLIERIKAEGTVCTKVERGKAFSGIYWQFNIMALNIGDRS